MCTIVVYTLWSRSLSWFCGSIVGCEPGRPSVNHSDVQIYDKHLVDPLVVGLTTLIVMMIHCLVFLNFVICPLWHQQSMVCLGALHQWSDVGSGLFTFGLWLGLCWGMTCWLTWCLTCWLLWWTMVGGVYWLLFIQRLYVNQRSYRACCTCVSFLFEASRAYGIWGFCFCGARASPWIVDCMTPLFQVCTRCSTGHGPMCYMVVVRKSHQCTIEFICCIEGLVEGVLALACVWFVVALWQEVFFLCGQLSIVWTPICLDTFCLAIDPLRYHCEWILDFVAMMLVSCWLMSLVMTQG